MQDREIIARAMAGQIAMGRQSAREAAEAVLAAYHAHLEAIGRVIVPVEDLDEAVCTLAAIRADRSTCAHYQELAGIEIQRLNKWIAAAKGQTDGRD